MIELDKKGQTYIATAVMISAMILTFGFLIKTAIINPHKTNFLMENVKVEMPVAYLNGLYEEDTNHTLVKTALALREFAHEKKQTLKIVFIGSLQDGQNFVFGNFWGQDCNYSNSRVNLGPIPDGSSAIVSKQTLKNNYNITFCGKTFKLRTPRKEAFQFYVEVISGTDVIKWDNTDKPL